MSAAKELRNIPDEASLARFLDVTDQVVHNWKKRGLPKREIMNLAEKMGCSSYWLLKGEGSMNEQRELSALTDEHPEFASVKRVKFKLSAGISGFEVEYLAGERAPLFFRRDWMASRGLEVDELFAVEVNGRSMEPSLFEGDVVVVNTGDTTPRDGEAFALNYEGELVVKRMIREGNAWVMRSDNADKIRYGDKRCDERTRVIGRIVSKLSERI